MTLLFNLKQFPQWNSNCLCDYSQSPDPRIHFPALNFTHRSTRKPGFKVETILAITLRASYFSNVSSQLLQKFFLFHSPNCRGDRKSFSSYRKVKFRKRNDDSSFKEGYAHAQERHVFHGPISDVVSRFERTS